MSGLAPLLLVLATLLGEGGRCDGSRDEVQEVPCLPTAARQLAHARAAKTAMRGTVDAERERLRDAAVAAYRAVRAYHPEARALCAEAAFRAGELLRAGGRTEAAFDELARARDLGAGTPFHARSLLEIGHLHRRAGRGEDALDAYLAVATDPRACSCRRDDAMLWAGRVWADAGRDADARRMWRRVAEDGEDPVDRVRAYDELALLFVVRGDPEAGAGVLNECRLALSEAALERTETGERVRSAMQRMRVIAALQRVAEERIADEGGAPREKK